MTNTTTDRTTEAAASVAVLPLILRRANEEIQAVLANLRGSRATFESAAVEKLQRTTDKLKQVTSATECATTDILDALDRAGVLVDELEAADGGREPDRAQAARDQLRQEIFGMMGALQFQDITTQQLAHAASLLAETEKSLAQIAGLFDAAENVGGMAAAITAPDPRTYDARATTLDAGPRQALADMLFA